MLTQNASILIVDDEQTIVDLLKVVLLKEGFTDVEGVPSSEDALMRCKIKTYHLLILDVMLPGQSGIDAAPFIRQLTNAPILFLSARTSDFDKLTGFAVGGDDYITKPFNPLEVVARVRSQIKRYFAAEALQGRNINTVLDFGRFQVNKDAGELIVEGQSIPCPALVFQLLLFLCERPNRIFSKNELYEQVWGVDALNDDNTVMVHIHRIRERIEKDPSNPEFLINMRGLGYKLVPANDKERG